ncbi:hypothetical protein B6N60_04979 [Richelia sinica FACHB-800]|uniref:Uncharacterized protein n=1 Tax=Richelia sinica FACHB-800 TaxID=1357546 RepID=A0A975Y7E5_9NOST|nr:hypothetical protein B6N60_04979 [Richelia sinica FACHB-800]
MPVSSGYLHPNYQLVKVSALAISPRLIPHPGQQFNS